MSSHLELQRISRTFGGTEVLSDVTFSVPTSSCAALLGASGSGKSTLLRIAAGLEEPSSGRVMVDGEDQVQVPPEDRGIAVVFQKPMLFPHLNVVDNVAFSARMAGVSRSAARCHAFEYLELVQLEDRARSSVSDLSGGQEQRVALARALARNPRILLLDEPFSSLDTHLRDEMHGLLEDLRAELAPSIVLVTHDRREASVLADSMAVLDSGRILQHGTVAQLHHQPASLAVNRILGGLNALDGSVVSGAHHSPLGRIPVQPELADGRAHLVARQEALQLTYADDDGDVAMVVGLRSSGAHTLVQVEMPDDEGVSRRLAVEVVGTARWEVGDQVGVRLADGHGWAVSA